MKCLNCGNENPNNSCFCSFCGTKLQQPVTNNYQVNQVSNVEENHSKNNSKKILIIVLVVIVGLCALVSMAFGGIFLFTQYQLNKVDKELQDQIDNIGDVENTDKIVKYNVGELVSLVDDSTWYVMSQDNKNVTLLSTENYGEKTSFSEIVNYYEQSIVKDIIENDFLPKLKTSVSAKGGDTSNLTARIVSVDDIRKILNVPSSTSTKDIEISSSYRWLFETGTYWTSTHIDDSDFDLVYVVEDWFNFGYIVHDHALFSGNKFNVRPVIETTIDNLK